ncbi:hypothetical protein V3664_30560 [Streptomyces sp. CS62]
MTAAQIPDGLDDAAREAAGGGGLGVGFGVGVCCALGRGRGGRGVCGGRGVACGAGRGRRGGMPRAGHGQAAPPVCGTAAGTLDGDGGRPDRQVGRLRGGGPPAVCRRIVGVRGDPAPERVVGEAVAVLG